jgi:hypothetical protein
MSIPGQKILVVARGGAEQYVFQPSFCGEAAQFGLILPVPTTLTQEPTLASATLFADLDAIAAPKVVHRTECSGSKLAGAGVEDAGMGEGWHNGTQVIDSGQVGIFDWVLLKAGSAASFTDWLDANGFPHAASADAQFGTYVGLGWYFVAFKVTASDRAPAAGTLLCGDLGPIQLAFSTDAPVIPTRIAQVSTGGSTWLSWRVYTLGPQQWTTSGSEYSPTPHFAGAVTAAHLATYAELGALAVAGDRLTKLDVGFEASVSADLTLTAVAASDYRETVTEVTYEDCGVCTVGPAGRSRALALGLGALAAALVAFAAWRRRRGQPARVG